MAALEIRDRIKELRRVPADSLRPHPKNWRRHPQAQVNALLAALGEIGFAGVIVAREQEDGGLMILDGHARQELAGSEVVPVVVTDLTEDESEKLLATYDPIGAMAEGDMDALRSLTEAMKFEDAALAAVVANLTTDQMPKVGLTDPDAAPPVPPEPITKLGDLWILGPHRLLCGDAARDADIEALMDGQVPRLLMTDPPYGVQYSSPGKRDSSGRLQYSGDMNRHEPMPNDDLGEGQPDFWRECLSRWPLDGDAYIFSPSGPLMIRLALAIEEAGIEHHQWLVWVKSRLVPGRGHYHYRHEHLFYGWRGHSSYNGSRKETSVWEADKPVASPEHPTMKPVELVQRAMANSSNAGDVVIDPFVGSGTAIIAAEQLGRRCFAMELDPGYVDVAVKRWEDYTGAKAERSETK